MEIQKITYDTKKYIRNDPNYPKTQTITDEDMNEIKSVVNNNAYKQDEDYLKLKNAALNAETEESKSLYVTDANKFGQLEVLGNHEQKTREGYNILDYLPNIVTSRNGLTVDKDEETGYLAINGTPTNDYTVISMGSAFQLTDILEDGETYTLWQENHAENNDREMYLQVRMQKINDGSEQYINSSTSNKTFTVDKSLYTYTASIQTGTKTQAGTFSNYKNRYMIYKGTDSKEFELYGATPSPDYPSEVKCLGSNKQLFDKSTAVEGLLQGDGTLSYDDNNYSTSDFIKVIPKESYYKTITGSSRFKFFDEDKNPISNTYNDLTDSTKAQSFIIPENVHYIRFTFLKTYIDEIKVEKGEQPTSYSPYEQGSTEIKISNETEENSKILYIQQEMPQGDYFVKEDDGWKEVHNWNKYVFSGNESIAGSGVSNVYYMSSITDYIISEENICISNYFKSINNVEGAGSLTDEDNVICFNNNHTNYRLYIKSSQYASSTELKEFLQQKNTEGNPAYVTYKTTTPTKLACTEEQSVVLEELSNLDLFDGVNNIITAEDIALLKLKYALDVKTYVDNQLANVNAQILNIAGGN